MDSKTTNEMVISYLQTLPDDVSLEDMMYHLYVQEKILRGIKDAEEDNVITDEEMLQTIEKW